MDAAGLIGSPRARTGAWQPSVALCEDIDRAPPLGQCHLVARLDKTGLAEITSFAREMAMNVAMRQIMPLRMSARRQLAGSTLRLDGAAVAEFDYTLVRAHYQPSGETITLTSTPFAVEPYAACQASVGELANYFEHVLAHEVCHRLQHLADATMFLPDGAGTTASNLGKAAKASGLPDDYLAYIRHPVELEAHATQMAVQIARTAGTGLNRNEFISRRAEVPLAGHIAMRLGLDPSSNTLIDDLAGFGVLDELAREAWPAYEMFR